MDTFSAIKAVPGTQSPGFLGRMLKKLMLVVYASILVGGFAYAMKSRPDHGPELRDRPTWWARDELLAEEATRCSSAKREVERILKAPSTAQFVGCKSLNGSNAASVLVDAQNGFGAMLRKTFVVTWSNNGASTNVVEMPR